MKNIQMIRMADRFRKKEEQKTTSEVGSANKFVNRQSSLVKRNTGSLESGQMKAVASPATSQMSQPQHDLCPIHGKPMDVIDVTTRERCCSSCALFGSNKGHDVRPEAEVLD